MVNYSNQENQAGIDQIVANSRVRAAATAGTNAQGVLWMQGTGVPTSFASGSQTYTAAILGGGLIVHANAGAVNGTLDTTANIVNYMNSNSAGVNVGDILQCYVFNTGSGVLTIVAGDGNTTFDANGIATIAAGVSKTLNIRVTNTSTPTVKIYM
jgi:hypothetical protein